MIGTMGLGFLQQVEQELLAPRLISEQPVVKSPLDLAYEQYPALRELGLQYKKSGADKNGSLLEFWPPGEPGSPDRPRPKEFDLQTPGIEVYSDKVRPLDILGDVVSHHMITADPNIAKVYSAFEKSVTPEQERLLIKQYHHARENNAETRDYTEWRERSGLPAFFRGHPFQQWPDEFNQQVYTPEQMRLLDRMMNYLSSKK